MDAQKKRQIQVTLRQLAEAHARTVASFLADALQAIELLPALLDRQPNLKTRPVSQASESQSPGIIDLQMLSVVYRGKRCFLGNTLPFRLMRSLANQANRYVSYEQLSEEVWDDVPTREAVRSVVKVLRSKLKKAGLDAIAGIIDGHVKGHYALMLDRL